MASSLKVLLTIATFAVALGEECTTVTSRSCNNGETCSTGAVTSAKCLGAFPNKVCTCRPGYCTAAGGDTCEHQKGASQDKIAVIVLDPIWDDSDAFQNYVALLRDFKLVKVMIHRGDSFSFYKNQPPAKVYRRLAYDADAPDDDKAALQICPQLKALGIPVEAVIPTSDPTVRLTDLLAACLGVRGNPSTGPLATARRDKWVMGESVRKAGLRSVRQKRVSSWSEAEAYLKSWDPPLSATTPCVFKIPNGVAGIGDYEVKSLEQAKSIVSLMKKTTYAGGSGNKEGRVDEFLIQEYLIGKEYAIDSVSRDGVHKVVAVWFEDFRPANGIFDQYFGFLLLDPADAFTKKLIDYARKSLDAIGLVNGAANTEIKWLDSEQDACLVETNARWAGINWNDGLGVERAAVGNDQITAAFTAYLDADGFAKMPAEYPLMKWGGMIMAINYKAGLLKAVPGYEEAKGYASYYNGDLQCTIGAQLGLTGPDAIPAQIGLVSDKKEDVDADYYYIIEQQKAGKFFDVVSDANLRLTSYNAGYNAGMVAFFAMLVLGAMVFAIVTSRAKQTSDDMGYLAVE